MSLNESAKTMLHEQVWRRFVRMPYGHVLDCADENGDAPFPTVRECADCYPNALGWMTATENGAFFTGLYLYALVEEYELRPNEKTLAEIGTLTNGLLLLCDVGRVDGFIARGVADDGVSHYPFSSEDQVGPWLIGLWKVYRAPFADETLRGQIRERLVRTVGGLRAHGYAIPTEWTDVMHGSFIHADYRGCAKGLFTAMLVSELLCGEDSADEYCRMRDEKSGNSPYTRGEILSHGFAPDMVREPSLVQFWIFVCAHLCVHELSLYDAAYAEKFRAGLRNNAVCAAAFLHDETRYDNKPAKLFDLDWRKLTRFAPPKDYAEAVKNGVFHCEEWGKINPRRHIEHAILGNMLFAAWIAATGGDETARNEAFACLTRCTDKENGIDWIALRHSYAFAAEAAAIDGEYKQKERV